MKNFLLFIFLALLVTGPGSVTGTMASQGSDPNTLFQNALKRSQQGDYQGALALLSQAKEAYAKAGLQEKVRLCDGLAPYFRHEQQVLAQPGKQANPSGMQLSWLLQDFNYSGIFLSSVPTSQAFKGILIFTRKVRDISMGPGRSIPIWGVLDAVVLPPLKSGEEVAGGTCQLKGKAANPGIAAVVMIKGQENQERFNHISQAWQLNMVTAKIEALAKDQVSCANESLGL